MFFFMLSHWLKLVLICYKIGCFKGDAVSVEVNTRILKTLQKVESAHLPKLFHGKNLLQN